MADLPLTVNRTLNARRKHIVQRLIFFHDDADGISLLIHHKRSLRIMDASRYMTVSNYQPGAFLLP